MQAAKTCMYMGTHVYRKEGAWSLSARELRAVTRWLSGCSQRWRLRSSEETLPRPREATGCLSLSAQATGAALAPDRGVSARMQKAPVRDVGGAARAGQPATLHLHHPRGSPSARHGAARQHWWSGKLGAATALAAAYLAPNTPI